MSGPNWQEFCTHGGEAMRKQPGDWCGWCSSYIPGAPPKTKEAAIAAATMVADNGPRTVDVDNELELVDEGGHSSTGSATDTLFDDLQGSSAPAAQAPTPPPPTLDLPPAATHARRTDPGTAHAAATTARRSASQNRDAVLLAHADAGTAGLSGEQLEEAAGLPYQTIGPRRPSLEDAGYITKARTESGRPLTRANARGNPEQVYVITDAGKAAAAALRSKASA